MLVELKNKISRNGVKKIFFGCCACVSAQFKST